MMFVSAVELSDPSRGKMLGQIWDHAWALQFLDHFVVIAREGHARSTICINREDDGKIPIDHGQKRSLLGLDTRFVDVYVIMSTKESDTFLSIGSLLRVPVGSTYDQMIDHASPSEAYQWKSFQTGSGHCMGTHLSRLMASPPNSRDDQTRLGMSFGKW